MWEENNVERMSQSVLRGSCFDPPRPTISIAMMSTPYTVTVPAWPPGCAGRWTVKCVVIPLDLETT